MTDATIRTTVTGGQIQGVAGAGTVVIENFTIYNRSVEEPAADAAGEPIAPCPYPGLAYFGPGDVDLFFGRDVAIARLTEVVGRHSLSGLVGASGSGKSSVVLAGLAPRLYRAGGWRFSYFRIGTELESNPFLALARALVPLYVESDSDTERLRNTKQLAASLETGELTLRDVFADCRSRNKGTRILLIADQFEEAFTIIEDEALRHRFIDVLLAGFPESAPGSGPDICLVLTLRADFYGRALRHRPLADALQDHVENLGPMKREELDLAIRLPAENAKVSFEPGLIATLLDDVESKPGSLPLLQFALREMWGRQEKRGITRKSYDDIGGVEGALAQRAEKIFGAMTENGANAPMVQAFRRLFTRLVTLGEGQEDTRRVVDRRELGDSGWSLAQHLAGEDNRLVVTNAPALSRETAEVAHEALIRHWPRLVDWINQDRAFQTWLRQIKPNVELSSANPLDDGPLLRGGMLAQGRDWLARRRDDLSVGERSYIEASVALQQRIEDEQEIARQAEIKRQEELVQAAVKLATEQRRRARVARAGGTIAFVLAILALGGGYTAYTAKQYADENSMRLRVQLLAVQARRVEAEATSSDEIELAGALALESIHLAHKHTLPAEPDAIETVRSVLIQLPLAVFSQPGSVLSKLAILTDGRLASGSGKEIRLWSKDRKGPAVILKLDSELFAMAALTDGRLASAGADGKITVWPKDGEGPPIVFTVPGTDLESLVELPDERLATAGDYEGRIMLWPKDNKGKATVLMNGSQVRSLAVLSGGRLASGDEKGEIKLWQMDGKGAPIVLSHGTGPVSSLATIADGDLAGTDGGSLIKIWPKARPNECIVLSNGSFVTFLAALPDGRFASGGEDGKIRLWPKGAKGMPVVLWHELSGSLVELTDGTLASYSVDGKIKLWPNDGMGEPLILSNDTGIESLAALPGGGLASYGQDGYDQIKIWPKDGEDKPIVLWKGMGPVSLMALADGELIAFGAEGIKVWQKGHKGYEGEPSVFSIGRPIASLALTTDGRVATGEENCTVRVWPKDHRGLPIVFSLAKYQNSVSSLIALPGGGLAGACANYLGLSRDIDKRDLVVLDEQQDINSLAVLTDGRLASAEFDKIKLLPTDGASAPVVLSADLRDVKSVVALPDGRLATAGGDGKIKLWSGIGKAEPVVLVNSSPVGSLVVLADGRLASGGNDGKIKVWRVNEQQLIAAICHRAGRNLTKDEWVRYVGSDTPWQPSCRELPSNWR